MSVEYGICTQAPKISGIISVSPPTDSVVEIQFAVLCGTLCHIHILGLTSYYLAVGRSPGSSGVPRNPLTRWDVSSIPANGIFLTKKLKKQNKNAQRVEND